MEFAGYSVEILSMLFLVAVAAGFLDTLVGGGGLLALPALILSGAPPLAALATNKLQGSMGTGTATLLMFAKKQITWRDIRFLVFTAFIGAAAGTIVVQFIDADALSLMIPVVLLFIAVYFLLSPTPRKPKKRSRCSHGVYQNMVLPSIGFYDGMFGPGTGSFFVLSGVSCKGLGMVPSVALAKPLNFATNIASLAVFLFAGQVIWVSGLLMMAGQAIGAWLGAHCLFRIDPLYLRILIVIMCLAMLIKYTLSMA